jgi:hypothetical protein
VRQVDRWTPANYVELVETPEEPQAEEAAVSNSTTTALYEAVDFLL